MTPFETLVQTHGAALLAYVQKITRDRQHAEDIVQETWLRAWRNAEQLSVNPRPVRGWLIRVAHNIAIDHYRARQARAQEAACDTDLISCPDGTDDILDKVMVEAILATLPEPHRQTMAEVYLADRTAEDAATRLGVPVGTVKSRLHYALRALRTAMPAFAAPQAMS